jgi:hypothetical protein
MELPRTAILCLVSALAAAALAFGISAATSSAHDHGSGDDHGDRYGHKYGHSNFGGRHLGWAKGLEAGVVHADAVIAQRDGTFAKTSLDRGFVKSVSGDQLTVTQATKKATYGETTLTVPSAATVVVNGTKGATLADVKPGQKVLVAQLPKRFLVIAADVPATRSHR